MTNTSNNPGWVTATGETASSGPNLGDTQAQPEPRAVVGKASTEITGFGPVRVSGASANYTAVQEARTGGIIMGTSKAQPKGGQTHIEVFTDGSCIGNPGCGGWGSVVLRKTTDGAIIKSLEASGLDLSTTNNRMEIIAVCATLEKLGRVTDEPITVLCDASLISNTMNGWLAKWKANGWKRSGGKDVENRDLWERLEAAAEGRKITWRWVRGHNGSKYNERADQLAYAAARRAEKKLTTR